MSHASHHEPGQEEGYARHEGDKHRNRENHHQVGQDLPGKGKNPHFGEAVHGEEAHPHRRGQVADHDEQRHHHAEIDDIYAEHVRHGHEDGQGDEEDGVALDEAAQQQHHPHHDEQHMGLARSQGDQSRDDLVGDLLVNDEPAEEVGRRDDEEQAHRLVERREENARKVPEFQVPVGEAQDGGIDAHRHRSLRGGEEAGHDAPDDDHRRHEGPEGPPEACPGIPGGSPAGGAGIVSLLGQNGEGGHHPQTHDDAGKKARHEEPGHGDPGDGSVEDEGDARRDHRPDHGGRRHEGGGDRRVIAVVHHGLVLDLSEPRRVGHGGSGHTREDDAGDDVHLAQAPGNVPHHGAREAEDAPGDAAGVHEVAGEDEEGNGQEGEARGAEVHPVGQHCQKTALAEKGEENHRGEADRCDHRYVDGQQADKDGKN
ncbi:hypothetical protein SDC9_59458 [bioreactor metagenome]|uniref:Sarcoplasmic reticulum histidine-rich calcium-binding protein-like n=1 Tax=bioreactor metagenome TaxID=1076179 RepID=A0A644XG18_9ZZZZ